MYPLCPYNICRVQVVSVCVLVPEERIWAPEVYTAGERRTPGPAEGGVSAEVGDSDDDGATGRPDAKARSTPLHLRQHSNEHHSG